MRLDRSDSGPCFSRRRLLLGAAAIGAVGMLAGRGSTAATTTVKLGRSPVAQPPLPYADDALAPVISAATIGFHYGRHHKGYVDATAKAVAGTPLADASLEEIMLAAANDAATTGLFNSAAQAWNHDFYWRSLSPREQSPTGRLKDAIDRDLGGMDAFKKTFAATCTGQFGSGWGWLVLDGGRLKTVATGNAGNPILQNQTPLLTVDVWEHAYYLDYQNRRVDYVTSVLDKKLNWEFAAMNFESA